MKNLISPLEPFYCEWQGNIVKMQIQDFEMSVEAGCLPEFTLKCWQVPIDNDEIEMYYKYKQMEENCMDCTSGLSGIIYYPGVDYKVEYKTFNDNDLEEEKMSLAKKYLHEKKKEEDKKAIELGALYEDGTLTEEGKDLLLNILLSDPKIREQFDKVLKDIDESGEE